MLPLLPESNTAPAAALQDPLEGWLAAISPANAIRALAESMPRAAVFAVNRERRVVYWSPGAEALLGFSAQETVGEHCLKSNRCQNCMVGCGLSKFGQVIDMPLTLHRPDGTPVKVRKSGRAFFDVGGQFEGGVEVLVADETFEAPLPPEDDGKAVNFHGLVTRDFEMRRSLEIVRNVARTDVPVLIRGESGTGKELIARGIHEESERRTGPFVAINCAALPEALMESELFGHVRGSFTGAVKDHKGVFQQADAGTLFLDEVAELPLAMQAKLLRVLQEQSFVPVGGGKPVQVDVRVVSATHRSLRKLVKDGAFREDLMYRLRVVPLFLPPLRERRGDIPLLLQRFIDERNRKPGRHIERVAPDAMRALLHYGWPGNVREMKNVVEYAFAVGAGSELTLRDLPPEFLEAAASPAPSPAPIGAPPLTAASWSAAAPGQFPAEPAPRASGQMKEKERILWALDQAEGNVGNAAALLGMSRPTFWRKRTKHGLS